MTSTHSAASHRVACWTTNVHPALLQACTNCSLPSTSPTFLWLGRPGHILPAVCRSDTRLDVFTAWAWATVISHPHLTTHVGRPCVTVLEKVAHQFGKCFRGGWEFALFPFAWSQKIWNMLRLCWHIKWHWLDHAHETNQRKPFYIFNKRLAN